MEEIRDWRPQGKRKKGNELGETFWKHLGFIQVEKHREVYFRMKYPYTKAQRSEVVNYVLGNSMHHASISQIIVMHLMLYL